MENTISVGFKESAPVVSGPISAYHTIFGHTVNHSHCYPMWTAELTEEEFWIIKSDPEKIRQVRVAAIFSADAEAKYLVGTSWK